MKLAIWAAEQVGWSVENATTLSLGKEQGDLSLTNVGPKQLERIYMLARSDNEVARSLWNALPDRDEESAQGRLIRGGRLWAHPLKTARGTLRGGQLRSAFGHAVAGTPQLEISEEEGKHATTAES